MSLWEKWEREKLEKMGVKIERQNDVQIHDMRSKFDFSKQVKIVLGAIVFCGVLVYIAATMFANGYWSDTYIARIFIERNEARQRQQSGRGAAIR